MKSIYRFLPIVVLLLCSFSAFSQNKIALLEPRIGHKSSPVSGMEINMVRGELRKAIGNKEGYEALSRTEVDQMMKEQEFQRTGMVNDEQRKKMGEMLGADYICVSTITKYNSEFYIEAFLINVESGQISNPASQYGELEGGKLSNMFAVCKVVAQELIGYIVPSREDGTSVAHSVDFGSRKKSSLTITVGNIKYEMAKVVSGSFVMGCSDEHSNNCYSSEKPYHLVTISKDYYIGKCEVTQELYEAVMGTNPSKWKAYDRPVENVSWEDAQKFCTELSRITGRTFSLPTEAEWEFAARGGKKGSNAKYSGSSNVAEVAWFLGNSDNRTHPVGRLRPNELGIFDMSGNVWEWCSDWYGDYSSANPTDPTGPNTGTCRVLRGGGWSSNAGNFSVSSRSANAPDARNFNNGFRIVTK